MLCGYIIIVAAFDDQDMQFKDSENPWMQHNWKWLYRCLCSSSRECCDVYFLWNVLKC
jgi:hypothetical protein